MLLHRRDQCRRRLDGYGWKTSRNVHEHVMAKKLCLISSSMTRRCSQTVRKYYPVIYQRSFNNPPVNTPPLDKEFFENFEKRLITPLDKRVDKKFKRQIF